MPQVTTSTLTLHIHDHIDGLGFGLVRLVLGHASEWSAVVCLAEHVRQPGHSRPRVDVQIFSHVGLCVVLYRDFVFTWWGGEER